MVSPLMQPEFELAGLTATLHCGLGLSSCANSTKVFKVPMHLESTSDPCYRNKNSLSQTYMYLLATEPKLFSQSPLLAQEEGANLYKSKCLTLSCVLYLH